jgi:hypothetical protein
MNARARIPLLCIRERKHRAWIPGSTGTEPVIISWAILNACACRVTWAWGSGVKCHRLSRKHLKYFWGRGKWQMATMDE